MRGQISPAFLYRSLSALLCDLSSATVSPEMFKQHRSVSQQERYQDQPCRFLFCLYRYISHGLDVPVAKCFPATSSPAFGDALFDQPETVNQLGKAYSSK